MTVDEAHWLAFAVSELFGHKHLKIRATSEADARAKIAMIREAVAAAAPGLKSYQRKAIMRLVEVDIRPVSVP